MHVPWLYGGKYWRFFGRMDRFGRKKRYGQIQCFGFICRRGRFELWVFPAAGISHSCGKRDRAGYCRSLCAQLPRCANDKLRYPGTLRAKASGCAGENRIDVVLGGPPCQSYSTLGKRKLDERANLFLQYKRVLQILNPRAFVFENVTGILSMAKGRLFEQIKEEFEALGYHLCHKVLNALEYGVPQQRERVFLVGMRGHNTFRYPTPTHGEGKNPF